MESRTEQHPTPEPTTPSIQPITQAQPQERQPITRPGVQLEHDKGTFIIQLGICHGATEGGENLGRNEKWRRGGEELEQEKDKQAVRKMTLTDLSRKNIMTNSFHQQFKISSSSSASKDNFQ